MKRMSVVEITLLVAVAFVVYVISSAFCGVFFAESVNESIIEHGLNLPVWAQEDQTQAGESADIARVIIPFAITTLAVVVTLLFTRTKDKKEATA